MTTLSEFSAGLPLHPAAPAPALQLADESLTEKLARLEAENAQLLERAHDAEKGWFDALAKRRSYPEGNRNGVDILITQQTLLEEILAELRRSNSTAHEGAVSSVEVKFLAPTKDNPLGRAQPVIKIYAGSEAPVDEAIIAYAKTVALAERGQMEGWRSTVEGLANGADS